MPMFAKPQTYSTDVRLAQMYVKQIAYLNAQIGVPRQERLQMCRDMHGLLNSLERSPVTELVDQFS